ncbi:citryl-CoA lyase [Gammaproteobacteria bacterium AH-315-C21]|nr:citryl-CoA lyase [Gammaproteobacteria bacterium AH-315-C21]
MQNSNETIQTKIWQDEAENDNPFAAKRCICSGYDVYGDLLGKISWIEYLYLLYTLEPPTPKQSELLEGIAIVLANPGPRDHSVRAAMLGGVGGSHSAASLIAALSVGAGQLGGAREVFLAMEYWQQCECSLSAWHEIITQPPKPARVDVWPEMEHTPGFDPHGASCPTPIKQSLDHLTSHTSGKTLLWLNKHREELERVANMPLALTGVIAAAFIDLDLAPEQGEMLYLLLRLPGAGAHALEQRHHGWRKYPFFKDAIVLTDDPGPISTDNI